jgi:predicted cupin superfamily sugar epimerase
MDDADAVIEALGLEPHPEGGRFRETWREPASTAIYYLLRAGERSHWHRVDATEVWHFYAGDALELPLSADGRDVARHVLGPDVVAGQRPQVVVAAGTWQSARPLGGWTLAGCTVAPAFQFSGFELAEPDWHPSP